MMKTENNLEFLVHYIFPPTVLIFGLVGNLLGIYIMLRRRHFPSRFMFVNLFIFDSIYLINLLVNYLEVSFGVTITISSSMSCKIQNYFSYSLATISPMILAFISCERFFEIKYPVKELSFGKRKIQIIYLGVILFFNILFYLPFPILVDKFSIRDEAHHYVMCSFINSILVTVLSYMDLINRVVVPFLLMLICSVSLLVSLRSNRVLNNRNLVITSVTLNLVNILLTVPILLHSFFSISEFSFTLTLYIFYVSYAINFYILVLTDSLIRSQLLILLKLKTSNDQDYQISYTQIQYIPSELSTEIMEISENQIRY